jgi:hypothetical protein
MKDVPFIPMLGAFRGNQLMVALNAVHPEARTTCECYRGHGDLPAIA